MNAHNISKNVLKQTKSSMRNVIIQKFVVIKSLNGWPMKVLVRTTVAFLIIRVFFFLFLVIMIQFVLLFYNHTYFVCVCVCVLFKHNFSYYNNLSHTFCSLFQFIASLLELSIIEFRVSRL